MKNMFWVIAFVLATGNIIAQKYNPSEGEISYAKELYANIDDDKEDVVILSKDVNVSFKLNTKDQKVEVIKSQKITFMGISETSKIQYPVFYDSESKVEEFITRDKSGKKTNAYVRDEFMSSADLFHTDYRVKYVTLGFPLQGFQRQVQTEKLYKDIKYFTSEYFNDSYRILKGSITITIPEWLDLEVKEFNFQNFNIENDSSKDGEDTILKFTYKDIEPSARERDMPGPSFIYPHLLFIAKSFKDKDNEVALFGKVDDLYGWYASLVDDVNVDASVYSDKVVELTKDASTDEDKIKSIFYWVQDNIRYVAFEDGIAGFKPDSPQNVFTKRYGDCKGMAILTKAMLEEAGLDSRLVWIGTDRLAYDYSIPSLSVDNHMICSVVIDGEPVFLDATEKYNRFGDYASRIQDKQALMQDNEGFKIFNVTQKKGKLNTDETILKLQLDGENIIGNGSRAFDGESRVMFQNIFTSFGQGDQDEILGNYLSSGNSNVAVSEILPFDSENREDVLKIDYNIAIDNAASDFDGKIYMDIDPSKNAASYIIEDRKVPYKLRNKQQILSEISLQLPDGYSVELLPENLTLSNDLLDVSVIYEKTATEITYKKNINFKKRLVTVEDFELWNTTFKSLKENQSKQIILAK